MGVRTRLQALICSEGPFDAGTERVFIAERLSLFAAVADEVSGVRHELARRIVTEV